MSSRCLLCKKLRSFFLTEENLIATGYWRGFVTLQAQLATGCVLVLPPRRSETNAWLTSGNFAGPEEARCTVVPKFPCTVIL